MSATIIVADDSAVIRLQVRAALEPLSFTVLEARDGEEVLELLRKFPRTALLLSDINMPRMNGLELLDCLSRRQRIPRLPVLIVTAQPGADLLERVRTHGARGLLRKPFSPEKLIAAVRSLVAPPAEGGASLSPGPRRPG